MGENFLWSTKLSLWQTVLVNFPFDFTNEDQEVPNAHSTTNHNGYKVEGNNVIKNHFIKMEEGYGDKVFHNKCHWVTNIYLVD